MIGWSNHTGKAVAFDRENVDTDQLIPARFMSTPRADGYGKFLLHDVRFDSEGSPQGDFPLNNHPDASILVSGKNFGSGSSREAAVYALIDFGIRVVVAPSFGDIFASNAVNNSLLPARVSATDAAFLLSVSSDGAEGISVDLDHMTISTKDRVMNFDLDPVWRKKLLNGWDDIDLTLNHQDEVAAYREQLLDNQKWRFPVATG